MSNFQGIFDRLTPSHRAALQWFHQHRGEELAWPAPLADGSLLLSPYKGIYVPKGLPYALSIRQMLAGPYADDGPDFLPDGSWIYRYFQEGTDPTKRDRYPANKALLACQADHVPVGVIRQTKRKPGARYRVLGLAMVREWVPSGYFYLDGLPADGTLPQAAPIEQTGFDPHSLEEGRRWIEASIVRRQGQGAFRAAVLAAYGQRCAVTGCDVDATLEAAHIVPYKGPHTNVAANGLLLRSDLHTLFDLHLITIDPTSLKLRLSPQLRGTQYDALEAVAVRIPADATLQPSREALALHQAAALAQTKEAAA